MPSSLRAIDRGLIYHVINRGNNRQNVFHKPDDFDAFLAALGDNHLLLHAAKTGRIVDRISIKKWPYHEGLHVSADGKRIVLGKTIFNAHTASVVQAGNRDSWRALAVASNGKQIFGGTSSYYGQPQLIESSRLHDFGPQREETLRAASFSPDGKFLCIAVDTVAEIWAIDEQLLLASLDQHLRMIDLVAFAPNGKMLATCSQDGATRLWDLSELVSRRIPVPIEPTAADRFQAKMPIFVVGPTDRKGVISSKADDGRWFVRVDYNWQILVDEEQLEVDTAIIAEQSVELNRMLTLKKRSYGPEQALGPPDTEDAGDCSTAWASKNTDNPHEWLIVEYSKAVLADEVVIHETYNPGAIQSVTLYAAGGENKEVWTGTPASLPDDRRELTVQLTKPFLAKFVAIELGCQQVSGWNEIDAVGLKEASSEKMIWADRASASSTYASGEMNPKFLATTPKSFRLKPVSP